MGFWELLLLAVGLSMDAFAVSICKGLCMRKADLRAQAICGAWFGGFQALMPVLGYFLGVSFADFVSSVDHWIAFILLGIIGGNMLKESFEKDESCEVNPDFTFRTMLAMAVATSIDALAVGVSFAFTDFEPDWFVYIAFVLIGIITFTLSSIGVKIGNIFGTKYKSKAEFAGGLILILLGLKILLEHLGAIAF